MLVGAFLTDLYALVAQWSYWAEEQISGWSDDPDGPAVDREELLDILRRARWSEAE